MSTHLFKIKILSANCNILQTRAVIKLYTGLMHVVKIKTMCEKFYGWLN